MSIDSEINNLINRYDSLNIVSKYAKLSKKNKTSKFSANLVIKNISKFSKLPNKVISDLDIPIPMNVEIYILKDQKTRDGIITKTELIKSLDKWSGVEVIIPHKDNDGFTPFGIHEEFGSVDGAKIIQQNNENWLVVPARITSRPVAYQMYLKQLKNEPIQVSAEFNWVPYYDTNGDMYITDIEPGRISLVKEGHITGNKIEIKDNIKVIN